jgi:beta-glucosidase-like glycosyl hydrolase
MKKSFPIALLIYFLALGFLQGCEDKEEIAKQKAREERRQTRQLEKQEQAAELEKLKTELEAEKKLREKQAAEKAAAEAARAKAKAIANAKTDLERNPGKYIISVGGCTHSESGILNVYTNVQACNFVNSGDFPVSNIQGNVHITTPNGTKAVPFRASGRLEARQTNMLPIIGIQKVQIPGKFVSSRLEVLRLTVEEEYIGDI